MGVCHTIEGVWSFLGTGGAVLAGCVCHLVKEFGLGDFALDADLGSEVGELLLCTLTGGIEGFVHFISKELKVSIKM